MRRLITFLSVFFALSLSAKVNVSIPDDLSFKAAHPRLMVNDDDFKQMKKAIMSGKNPALVKFHDAYMAYAASSVEAARHFVYETDPRGNILTLSRTAFLELGANAYAYRYTRDKAYLKRASDILEDVCSFDTWHPQHYLDVAEMAMAVAVSYDWLYDKLSPQLRKKCESAIVKYLFDTAEDERYRERFLAKNNWGQVLNTSLICCSIAFYDLDRERARKLIRRGVNDIQISMEKGYAPDGIYPEGAMYWGYGTSFQIMANEALTKVYGSDFGLSECDGFKESAQFMIFSIGNIGKAYNYSDSGEKRNSVPSLWYFAYRFNDPDIIYNEYHKVLDANNYKIGIGHRMGFQQIYHASLCDVSEMNSPKKTLFHGRGTNPLLMARTGWEKGDIYLGAKGGSTRNGHAHMDAGSFVYEDNGVRWVREPGMPSYSKSEPVIKKMKKSLWKQNQESVRWKIFGYNNAQHSTLTINGKDQLCSGMATLEEVFDSKDRKGGTFDLTSTYADQAKVVKRSIYIADDERLEVIDTVTALDSLDAHVRWNIPTDAQVSVTDEGIVLSVKNKKMLLSAEGVPVTYTTDMYKPEGVPQELDRFYEDPINFAAFIFTVPAGKTTVVKTTLKQIK